MMKRFLSALALALPLTLPLGAAAQTAYPSRPIQMLIPYPAGGTTDVMARALQEPLQKALGQTIIVENKAGASGVLAAREVARARPDGHSLLFINSGIVAVTPHVQKDAGYDGVKDFAPVAMVTSAPLFVIVPGTLPVTDLKSWIAWARKQPGPLPYASAGVGSFGHLTSEMFAKAAGLKMTHVPYRGQAPTTTAVMSGEVPLLITSMSSVMREGIASGRLKLLGVTSAQPNAQNPGVPTVASVLPGFAAETWFGFITTAGTPGEVVARLNKEINALLPTKDIQDRMLGLGQEVKTMTPAQLGALIADDSARWGQVVRDNQISSQ
ncbi:MAG: tripartite tricarboxylate transporter substrate binding protein [Proteobacteria bacterium]|nr:tripartite tricarboxylate transporter substrate binding protein [Pseudomonadota bacterium]